MSELINTQAGKSDFRWMLLTTVCTLALCGPVTGIAQAGEDDHPTVWIELGGQLERVDGTTSRFIAPYLLADPQPPPFSPVSPIEAQRTPRYAVGGEGRISFEPNGTNWVFTAAVRYGRSNGNKHVHNQTYTPPAIGPHALYISRFADTKALENESHFILDFAAGKDVGLGMFGNDGTSILEVGVRYAQFSSKTTADIHVRPHVGITNLLGSLHLPSKYLAAPTFNQYTQFGHSERNFRGIGPSLSWTASAPVIGHADGAELALDWGINGAVLFGRQKARVHHNTYAYHSSGRQAGYAVLYKINTDRDRSRTVTVPNLGGFAGVSVKFPNAKVSLGYRADFFFGAADTGIDARKTSDLSFHGPFAKLSIGLGG